MQYYGLDWMGTVLGLLSIYFMGRREKAAFVLRIAASVFWASFGVVAHTPAAILANVVAILLCLRGVSRKAPAPTPARPLSPDA
jgi:hypothetical protein